MKTTILTMAAVMIMAVVTTKNTYANANNNNGEVSTVLTNVSKINKIEIHGNVELYISDGAADQVKVYNKYYAESALVQSQNGVLRISSYTDKKLVVWVTAADLHSVSAYDNAEVKSFGNISKLEFEVNLYNTATADLNLDAYKATFTVNNNAKATLKGSVNDYSVRYDNAANVNHANLIAVNTSEVQMPGNVTVKAKSNTLAGL